MSSLKNVPYLQIVGITDQASKTSDDLNLTGLENLLKVEEFNSQAS